jgi:outer membrane protein OmpA-like peptidoglycan-associated protein
MEGAGMLKPRVLLVVTLTAAVVLPGCEFGRRYVRKPWGQGTFIPAAVCAVVGGFAGAAIESQGFTNESIRSGSSCATITMPNGDSQTTCEHDKPAYPGAIAIGAGSGALLCGLLGHYLWDPEVVTPVPTPPPLPPVASPTATPLPTPVAKRIVLRGVHFDFDKTAIREDSRPVLDEAVDVLKENPNVRIAVEGYTDNVGTEIYNEKLSVQRAEAVFRYLVNHGIAPERMEVVGYGETRPVASNDTADGRAENRRVELRVVDQPGALGTEPQR